MTVYFESMKRLSYLSIIALVSIAAALLFIIFTDFQVILSNETPMALSYINLSGIPYFFGTALFMFEGNALALEIYHQT
jgi:hypothetical protein